MLKHRVKNGEIHTDRVPSLRRGAVTALWVFRFPRNPPRCPPTRDVLRVAEPFRVGALLQSPIVIFSSESTTKDEEWLNKSTKGRPDTTSMATRRRQTRQNRSYVREYQKITINHTTYSNKYFIAHALSRNTRPGPYFLGFVPKNSHFFPYFYCSILLKRLELVYKYHKNSGRRA